MRKSRKDQFWQLENKRWIVASRSFSKHGGCFVCFDTDDGRPIGGSLSDLQLDPRVRSYASRNGAARSLRRFEAEAGL